MSRIELVQLANMTPEQRMVHDAAVAGKRGRAPLPLLAWLESPEFASRAQRLGEFVRYDTTLVPRLSELAILVVAKHWEAPYEWAAHEREARLAKLDERVIAALAAGEVPAFKHEDESLVYEFTQELIVRRTVGEALYARAVDVLGEKGIVELVGIIGYYTLIAMTLNVFDIVAQPG